MTWLFDKCTCRFSASWKSPAEVKEFAKQAFGTSCPDKDANGESDKDNVEVERGVAIEWVLFPKIVVGEPNPMLVYAFKPHIPKQDATPADVTTALQPQGTPERQSMSQVAGTTEDNVSSWHNMLKKVFGYFTSFFKTIKILFVTVLRGTVCAMYQIWHSFVLFFKKLWAKIVAVKDKVLGWFGLKSKKPDANAQNPPQKMLFLELGLHELKNVPEHHHEPFIRRMVEWEEDDLNTNLLEIERRLFSTETTANLVGKSAKRLLRKRQRKKKISKSRSSSSHRMKMQRVYSDKMVTVSTVGKSQLDEDQKKCFVKQGAININVGIEFPAFMEAAVLFAAGDYGGGVAELTPEILLAISPTWIEDPNRPGKKKIDGACEKSD